MKNRSSGSSVTLALALILTLSLSLVKGGAPQWASLLWVALCAATTSIILTANVLSKKEAKPPITLRALGGKNLHAVLTPFYCLAAFQAWVFIQHALFSQDKSASLEQGLIGLGMLTLLLIWSKAITNNKAMHVFYLSFVTSAVLQAIYGLWIFLADIDMLLWMPKVHYLDRPTGTFVNANHFAAYLVLATIVFLSVNVTKKQPTQPKSTLIRIIDQLYSPSNAILALLLITLVASRSFGAMVSLAVVMMILGIRFMIISNYRRYFIFAVIVSLSAFVLFVLALDYATIEQEINGLSHTLIRRIELSKASYNMLQHHWLAGVGGGAFYSQFSQFRTLDIGNAYYNYAHNDFIQFWIEYGVVGVILLTLFVGSAIRHNLTVLARSKVGIEAGIAYASVYSTIAIAVHSLVDFPLHIPGFSVCYLVLISLNSLNSIAQKLSVKTNKQ